MVCKRKYQWMPVLLAVACLVCAVSCHSDGDPTQETETPQESETQTTEPEVRGNPKAVETLLRAILDCPNEELMPMEPQYFSLEESPGQDPEEASAAFEEEKERWSVAVGDLFRKDDFAYFMEHCYGRLGFHSLAAAHGVTITMAELEAEAPEYGSQYFNATVQISNGEGNTQECVTRWKIEYNAEDPEWIADVELVDDGGATEIAQSLGG